MSNTKPDSSQVKFIPAGTGAVVTTVQDKLREGVSVKDFGAIGDGIANDTAAINNAITAAAVSVGGQEGAIVYFPTGTYLINSTITLPNRVGLQGANGRGTSIKALAPFTGTSMLYAQNGTSSMFGSWIHDMYIDCRGVNMTSAVVVADAWQETCGMTNVLISFDGTTPYGLLVQIGYGGVAYLPLRDIEIFSDSTVANAAIRVSQISLVGGFVLSVDGFTAAGSVANPMGIGIQMVNDSLYVKGLHCEYVDSMITMDGAGSLSADTCTGSFNGIIDMVTIGSGFTGKVNLRTMIPNGASGNVFKDNRNGRHIAASEGMLGEYTYQPSAFKAIKDVEQTNVTGNGEEVYVVFGNEIYDYLAEYNPTTGVFTAARTGKYLFETAVKANVVTGATVVVFYLATPARSYEFHRGAVGSSRDTGNNIVFTGSCIADMTAGQTARVAFGVYGTGATTCDILVTATHFSGQWLSR